MVLFVQGASHAGKSCLAAALARRCGAAVFSLDLLKMGLLRSKSPLFSDLTPEDDACIEARLWPIVREVARTALENDQTVVFEGVHMPFEGPAELDAAFPGKVARIAIVFTDAYIRENIDRIACLENAVEKRLVAAETGVVDDCLAEHRTVRQKAERCGWSLLEIESPEAWTRKVLRLEGFSPLLLDGLSARLFRPSADEAAPSVC